MAELLVDDVHEKILTGLDVKDLLRFKSVCKSWHSLISSKSFVKAHMNHSYNNDRNNSELRHRRVVMSTFGFYSLVGSSNGLVCMVAGDEEREVFVANPYTKEMKKVQKPHVVGDMELLCWGFGYDSSRDDYKVILGFKEGGGNTCFLVLSLKSNVWRVVGQLRYVRSCFGNEIGILCNGAVCWFMDDPNNNYKKVILSFDLSREEFKEIPQPDDPRYKCTYYTRLAIIDECLCIDKCSSTWPDKWVMKNYNVKPSWTLLPYGDRTNYDVVHGLKHYMSHKSPIVHDDFYVSKGWGNIHDPIYVRSLVSPHVNGKLKKTECQRRISKTLIVSPPF